MDERRQSRIQDVLKQQRIGAWLGWRPDEILLMTGYADETKLVANADFPVVRKPVDMESLSRAFA